MANIKEQSIFSKYDTIENRVTAALLQILSRGGEKLINFLLDEKSESLPSNEILVMTQDASAKKRASSVPDGRISSGFSFDIIIESKIAELNCAAGLHDMSQLISHRTELQNSTKEKKILVYVTTDTTKPNCFNPGELWYNWTTIYKLIDEYVVEEHDEILEFLIEQFKLLLEELKLLDFSDTRVIIVGGSWAEPIAEKYGFYACQNHRSFKPAKYMAFAYKNKIRNLFEIMSGPHNDIDLRTYPDIDQAYLPEYEPGYNGEPRQVFLLKKTNTNDLNIVNDATDINGKPCAFVRGQTYTTKDKILTASKTSELK